MPLGMSSLYNRYDLGHSLFGVEGRILYVDAVLAKGYPEPKITWTFDFDNGTTLRPGESLDRYHVFENGTLRITNVSYHDQGLVETIANNSVGKDRVVSAITIYGREILTSWLSCLVIILLIKCLQRLLN